MGEPTVPVSIAMPKNMAREIRVLAAQQDKSRSQLVREVLEKVLPSYGSLARNSKDEES